MKKIFLLLLLLCETVFCQSMTGSQLLEKAIAFHDPNGHWSTFNNILKITMTTPEAPDRVSYITINLPGHFFQVKARKEGVTLSIP